MPTATDVGFIEMRIAKVVAFGPRWRRSASGA